MLSIFYVFIVDPNPCENSAPCIKQGSGYYCVCPLNKYGERCELDKTSSCDPNPCKVHITRSIYFQNIFYNFMQFRSKWWFLQASRQWPKQQFIFLFMPAWILW